MQAVSLSGLSEDYYKTQKAENTIKYRGKTLVCRIFDCGENQLDRYTIAFKWNMLYRKTFRQSLYFGVTL